MKRTVLAVAAAALVLAGCSSETEQAAPTTTTTAAATTTVPQTPTGVFKDELRAGGIVPTQDQVPLLIPAAVGNCDALTQTTLPVGERYAKMVELSRLLGAGKNVFDLQSTAETFMNASIRGFCPQFESLIPA